jgi:sugar O-acyltransferase (sialic acid O-acetyltransferase NeuD family)
MKKIDFVVAGVGFGDIIILIEDIIKKDKRYNFLGFIDDFKKLGFKKNKYKVIGDWKFIKNKNIFVFNSSIKNFEIKEKTDKKLNSLGAKWISLIHPSINTNFSIIGKGVAIFNNVFLGPNTKIGFGTVIHSFASIGHDVKIGKNCFIAPGAKILGGVKIEDGVIIGSNSVCMPKTIIKKKAIIGAGSVVDGIIKKKTTMFGGFAKKII